jgi:hypothetical protein
VRCSFAELDHLVSALYGLAPAEIALERPKTVPDVRMSEGLPALSDAASCSQGTWR